MLTTSSGRQLEVYSHSHIVSLMYKLLTSAGGCDGFSMCFDRGRGRRQRELTNNKTQKGKYLIRIMLKDVLSFSHCQEKRTFGLSYKITLTRNTDNADLIKGNAINNAKLKFNAVEFYAPHYTPSISSQAILSKQILNRTPTELQYDERFVFMKEVNTQNFWTAELGTQEGINFRIWIIIGFQQRDRQDSQNLNHDTFYRPPVTSAQCIIGTEKCPDSAIFINYKDDDN